MTAVTEALRLLQARPDLVATISSDNQMLVRGMTEWLPGWKRRGWRKADNKPVTNRDLWQTLDGLASALPGLRWQWVKGHDGERFNEMADDLASNAATGAQPRNPVV
jgi:ribonuclease HI